MTEQEEKRAIVLEAIKSNPADYQYLNSGLKRDPEFIQVLITQAPILFIHVPKECVTKELCLQTLKVDSRILEYMPAQMKDDIDVVHQALKTERADNPNDDPVFEHASDRLMKIVGRRNDPLEVIGRMVASQQLADQMNKSPAPRQDRTRKLQLQQ